MKAKGVLKTNTKKEIIQKSILWMRKPLHVKRNYKNKDI